VFVIEVMDSLYGTLKKSEHVEVGREKDFVDHALVH
jgi:hypothetical protein